jgi:arsenite-transporting ATPase
MERRSRETLTAIPTGLTRLPRTTMPLTPRSLVGADALRAFAQGESFELSERHIGQPAQLPSLVRLVDELAEAGRGVILTMGKGGVGKTTIAAAIAIALAERGFPVRLTTTDPAAHIAATVNGAFPNLKIGRIDPRAETIAYTTEVMKTSGASLDEQGKALLAEDLRSPCTEEIAVFRAFAQAVASGESGFVVLDTAPTGHTILLLDAALAYHREVVRQGSGMPESVEKLLPRLRDPSFSHVLIVALPEATPVHEAARLQEDLVRAGIQPFAWIVNQSLSPLEVTDPVLLAGRDQETAYIREVTERLASRVALVPWRQESPIGRDALMALVTSNLSVPIG